MNNTLIYENDSIKLEKSFMSSDELVITDKNSWNSNSRICINEKDFEILYHQFKIHGLNRQ